jgi:hypothetical protein
MTVLRTSLGTLRRVFDSAEIESSMLLPFQGSLVGKQEGETVKKVFHGLVRYWVTGEARCE